MQIAFVALTVVALALAQTEKSPLEGRWAADLSASRLHPGVSVRSITLEFAVRPDRVRITDDVVLASGENVRQGPAVFLTDGQEHPNDALRPGMVVRAHWPHPRRLETVLTRPRIVERVTYEVSSDGTTLTNTTEGPLGIQVIVFRRPAQSPGTAAKPAARPAVGLPDEAAGIDGIVRALVSAYDQYDIVALGEMHERRVDSDLRIALVRHPDFAKKVRTIVVEFATTAEQATLDRYIRGENVSRTQLDRVRPREFGSLTSDDPIYGDFFAAVREVNAKLPPDARIRVFGGEDNRNRAAAAVSILKDQVLQKRGKALVIYGGGHFWRAGPDGPGGFINSYPGRTLAVIPLGGPRQGPASPSQIPDYQQFDRALKTQVRPVLVPLQRLPFRNFKAGDFLSGDIVTASGGSIWAGSTTTLGQMADAVVYFGRPPG